MLYAVQDRKTNCDLSDYSHNCIRVSLLLIDMQKKKQLDMVVLSKILRLALPYRGLFVFCALLAIIMAPISKFGPVIITKMVDNHIFKGDIPGLKNLALLYLVIVLLNVLFRYLFIYYSSKLGQSVVKDLRVKVFDHLTSLRLRYFDQTPIGTLTTRTISDVQAINDVFTQGVLTLAADILGIFAVLGFMLYTSWKLTLICVVTLPLMILATYIFKEKVKVAFTNVRNEISRMNAFLQEQISGMQVVQMFAAEKQEALKFKDINRKYTTANLNAVEYYAIFFPVVELISALALSLLVWWGSKGIWNDSISVGAYVAFPLYLNMLFRPVRMLADKLNTLQMGIVAGARIFDVLENDEKIEDLGTYEQERLQGELEFDSVWFAYDGENDVLKDVSFKVKPGETLAIVGSTGSGKTTIINILNRFYEIRKGKINIDGVDLKKYKTEQLRERVAMVLQDVFLFDGTVYENIVLRDPSITRAEVIAASKIIGAHPYIERLPDGYDFKITERGSNLSMGQRQLITFVRALVFDPDILILDEATSSIDTETEGIIQYAIEKLIEKRTSIIIAHRLSTIQHADNIIVLNKGRVMEQGKHAELIEREEGAYRRLYEKQFEKVAVSEGL